MLIASLCAVVEIHGNYVVKIHSLKGVHTLPDEMRTAYLQHRHLLGFMYPIPALYDIQINDTAITTIEERIPGLTLDQLARQRPN